MSCDEMEIIIDKKSKPKTVQLKIPVRNTGNFINCSDKTKGDYTKLLMTNKNLAHFTLSIPQRSLSNIKFSTLEREKIAQ